MGNLKGLVITFVILALIMVFPVMLSYEAIGNWAGAQGINEVFVTLIVEITLLTATAILAYLVSRIYKGTPFQRALVYLGLGVFLYGVGDFHLLVWMYTGNPSFPAFLGEAGSNVGHAIAVGAGFILVITGIYKIALARKNVTP